MKILVVSQYYFPEQFRINDICEELVRHGNEVTVLTGLPNYPLGEVSKDYKLWKKRREVVNGVNILRCTEIGRGNSKIRLAANYLSFMFSASIKAMFMKEEFDVVYVYQLSPVLIAVPGIIYSKIRKIPIHLYCLDLWPESLKTMNISESSSIFKIFSILSKYIYKQIDHIYVTSEPFIDYFNDILGIDCGNIKYLPQHAENLFSEISGRIVDNDVVDFLFAGNIGTAQDLETLIQAITKLTTNVNYKFHIVGDGSNLENIKIMSNKLGVDNHLIFYGNRNLTEMTDFYSLADVFLLTLRGDSALSTTIPGKLQSYLAAGKPVLAAINGPANVLINENHLGISVMSGDVDGLANNIDYICNHIDVFKVKGINCDEYFKQNFSLLKHIETLIQYLS